MSLTEIWKAINCDYAPRQKRFRGYGKDMFGLRVEKVVTLDATTCRCGHSQSMGCMLRTSNSGRL